MLRIIILAVSRHDNNFLSKRSGSCWLSANSAGASMTSTSTSKVCFGGPPAPCWMSFAREMTLSGTHAERHICEICLAHRVRVGYAILDSDVLWLALWHLAWNQVSFASRNISIVTRAMGGSHLVSVLTLMRRSSGEFGQYMLR